MTDHPFVKGERTPCALLLHSLYNLLVSTLTSNYMVIPMRACPGYYEKFIKKLMGIMPWVVSCWLDVY